MAEFRSEHTPDEDEIDDSILHPSPEETGLWSIDDAGFLKELDRRWADESPTIPWSEIRKEPF